MYTIGRSRLLGWVAVGILLTAFCAVDRALADTDQEVARLEAMLKAQQQRMDALEADLAQARAQDEDLARAEAMRQEIREILSEQEFRESLMPSLLQAGYDKGFFIRSSDDKFLIQFNGRMQFRWTHYNRQSRNRYQFPGRRVHDLCGFDVRRIRFQLSGHAYDPNLTYMMKFWADSSNGYDLRPLYIWANYKFLDEFQVRVGMFQVAATRAGFASSANMQFVEYPETVALFDPGEAVGVRFWGQLFDKRLEYFIDVVNSFNGRYNRTITTDPAELDSNPGLAFRAVWHAIGEDPTTDFVSFADLDHKETPSLDLGFHYLFNDNYGDAASPSIVFARSSLFGGGFGVTSSHGTQMHQFGTDAAFKWRGFSATGEYICRFVDVRRAWRTPFAPVWLLTGEEATTAQHGAYVQLGYFLPIPGHEKKLEAVARVGGFSTNVGPGKSEGTWIYSGGLNYYFEGNRVKLQTDVTRISEVPISANSWLANVNDKALIWRVQLQVAF